jgi:hypothetical protein
MSPDAGDDAVAASTYDKKLEELEAAVDAPLSSLLDLRQLALLREQAIQRFRSRLQDIGIVGRRSHVGGRMDDFLREPKMQLEKARTGIMLPNDSLMFSLS